MISPRAHEIAATLKALFVFFLFFVPPVAGGLPIASEYLGASTVFSVLAAAVGATHLGIARKGGGAESFLAWSLLATCFFAAGLPLVWCDEDLLCALLVMPIVMIYTFAEAAALVVGQIARRR